MHPLRYFKRTFHRLNSLSYHQVKYELKSNVWLICLFYGLIGTAIAGIAYYADMHMLFGLDAPNFFQADYELTRQIVSSLVAGIITLNAFTLNSILVVLTNFSGQFTPRMLTTFISDRRTQHLLGIFNLSFVFILLTFFLIDEEVASYYALIPTLTILVMLLAVVSFVVFINHTIKWMQVPNIMQNMKNESQQQILTTLVKDLEEFRTSEPKRNIADQLNGEGMTISATKSGYIQIVDYKRLIKYAQSVDTVIRFEKRIGEFVLKGTPLLTYWKNGRFPIEPKEINKRVFIGSKKTEVQDIEFGINKLKEIAIKSLGNDDPHTASNAIFQLTDLLLSISKVSRFSSYLTDSNNELRVIIKKESFAFYLNSTFSHITLYAKEDPVITNDILEAMTLLVQSIDKQYHECSWKFALMVAKGYAAPFSFEYNEQKFYRSLEKISDTTGHQDDYQAFLDEIKDSKR
ncbi:DUF2254 domain-containing protein [Alkalicoccobacillus plakortidis]|uniref:DUF2254 domain-containing protein n=1 Tax=Alkalicoccobacillus plakortidis TaxID=444060 RepID=A0ABT0XK47_9BACI|nr:DUF2254 domain-containing protein [Alkalicoccobacillus plakortidis]MCM2676278.1 DUF2254 domain-containing protein [Alkalicoccobacillus plakortidis]